jgi:hypothetical protein
VGGVNKNEGVLSPARKANFIRYASKKKKERNTNVKARKEG